MNGLSLFSGITPAQQRQMEQCFHPLSSSFGAGETIMAYSSSPVRLGTLLSGRAHLSTLDAEGRENRLEELEEGDVFGEMFILPLENQAYWVEADTECQIMFIDYPHLIKRCENACPHHSQLVDNLFRITARKTQAMAMHIHVLSQRSLRQKLLAYFSFLRLLTGSDSFTLPLNYRALADYLGADRSAMTRELSKMKREGLLKTEGRRITLL